VLASSNGGSLVNFSAGTKDVFVDYPAGRAVYEDASGNIDSYPITGGTINGTTIGATTPATGVFTTLTAQTEVLKGTGTNLFTRSSDLSNAAWGPSNLTVTGGQTDPFGGSTAALLNDGTAVSQGHSISQFITSGGPRTFSVYAKAGTANFVALYDSQAAQGAYFNINTGAFSANLISAPTSYSITNAGNGWYRISITTTGTSAASFALFMSQDGTNFVYTGSNKTIFLAAPQLEIGSTANTYIPTTTTAVYGTPTLSFSGVSTIGLESNGSLFVQPAGTGALQAQATTSSAVGGNVRGQNGVDWQMARGTAGQVASGVYPVISGGFGNANSGFASVIGGGYDNGVSSNFSSVLGGRNNTASGTQAVAVGGYLNTSAGYLNFIGGGFTNSATSGSAVTTQSATMNATTAVTLSGSNANIKVGQYITGTSISGDTYVAAISGTSLTLSKVASGSSTSTLSFFTPHGVVVGGGNNQATGSYSFIGGGGDAGTAANRNVASGDFSVVVGGIKNTASGFCSFIGGGGADGGGTAANLASGSTSVIGGGYGNTASAAGSAILGGYSHVANGQKSTVIGGSLGTTRGITANIVFPASNQSISAGIGVTQSALLVLGRQTTDATPTALTSDPNAAGTTNQIILPNNSAYAFKGTVIANVTGAANGASWSFEGAIMRGANAASTVLMGTPAINRVAATAGATAWAIALTADTTNGGLAVTVTGAASTTIRFVAQISTTEVTF
jgi:hypothetical protein